MNKLIRRCAQCRLLNHRELMLRIQRKPDGSLTLANGQGRSLYLCRSALCLRRAARNKSLLRLLPEITAETWRRWCEKLLVP